MKLWKKTCKEVKLGRKFGVKDPISCCLPSPKRSTSKRKITHHFFASYIHAQNNESDFQTNKTFVCKEAEIEIIQAQCHRKEALAAVSSEYADDFTQNVEEPMLE